MTKNEISIKQKLYWQIAPWGYCLDFYAEIPLQNITNTEQNKLINNFILEEKIQSVLNQKQLTNISGIPNNMNSSPCLFAVRGFTTTSDTETEKTKSSDSSATETTEIEIFNYRIDTKLEKINENQQFIFNCLSFKQSSLPSFINIFNFNKLEDYSLSQMFFGMEIYKHSKLSSLFKTPPIPLERNSLVIEQGVLKLAIKMQALKSKKIIPFSNSSILSGIGNFLKKERLLDLEQKLKELR